MENWENKLDDLLEKNKLKTDLLPKSEERERADKFICEVVDPAFKNSIEIFEKHGRKCIVVPDDFSIKLVIWSKTAEEFRYSLKIEENDKVSVVIDCECVSSQQGNELNKICNGQPTISNVTVEHLGEHIVKKYDQFVIRKAGC